MGLFYSVTLRTITLQSLIPHILLQTQTVRGHLGFRQQNLAMNAAAVWCVYIGWDPEAFTGCTSGGGGGGGGGVGGGEEMVSKQVSVAWCSPVLTGPSLLLTSLLLLIDLTFCQPTDRLPTLQLFFCFLSLTSAQLFQLRNISTFTEYFHFLLL